MTPCVWAVKSSPKEREKIKNSLWNPKSKPPLQPALLVFITVQTHPGLWVKGAHAGNRWPPTLTLHLTPYSSRRLQKESRNCKKKSEKSLSMLVVWQKKKCHTALLNLRGHEWSVKWTVKTPRKEGLALSSYVYLYLNWQSSQQKLLIYSHFWCWLVL